ncbi:MAG: hypothetical protein KAW17_10515 [Candidatus Eisenbacteria sp.]|nr:hypothetical protein [Candidatus Eisenbacteria bacterium]
MRKGSVFSGMMWMIFLSVLLFWLPLFGPLLAGIVGGKKSGGVLRALMACILPAIILSGLVWFSFLVIGLPLQGFVVASVLAGSLVAYVVFHNFALVCGAIVGGALA